MIKPLAIIVKGNPKYINIPKIKPMAERFYNQIKELLEKKGFRVEFDPGEPYTSPKEEAVVWIGHSRGIDRLRFAPARIQTIALRTKDKGIGNYKSFDVQGEDPLHYELSDSDKEAISKLRTF